MNGYKELIYALKSCQHIASNCIDCPLSNTKYYNPKTKECEVHLHNVAADAIEQLVRERDAAVAAVAEHPYCYNCKHRDKSSEEHPCIICNQMWPNASECKWHWRGLEGKHE